MKFFLCDGLSWPNDTRILTLVSATSRRRAEALYQARFREFELKQIHEVDTSSVFGPHISKFDGEQNCIYPVQEHRYVRPDSRLYYQDQIEVQRVPSREQQIVFASCHPDDFYLLILAAYQHELIEPGTIYTITDRRNNNPISIAVNRHSPLSYAVITREREDDQEKLMAHVQVSSIEQSVLPIRQSQYDFQFAL